MADAKQHFPPDKVETTPSGIVIQFYDKRTKAEHGQGQRRHYLICPPDGEPFQAVSVTTVLDVIEKPALKSWAQKVGVAGCIALAREGLLPQDTQQAIDALTERELCWWHKRDSRASEGTLAHDELARLLAGERPDFARYPVSQHGYVQGIAGFLADYRPEVEATEQMVASPTHGVSGRLDARLRVSLPNPKLLSGVGLFDLKSVEFFARDKSGAVKEPYDESKLQLGAYEGLSIESGHEPTDFRAVLRVDSTGAYDVTCTDATLDHFLPWLDGYRSRQALRAGKPFVHREAVPA